MLDGAANGLVINAIFKYERRFYNASPTASEMERMYHHLSDLKSPLPS
jgi:hypothetical protein